MSDKPNYDGLLDPDFFTEDNFSLLSSKVINEFECRIALHLPNSEKKGFLNVRFTQVIKPVGIRSIALGQDTDDRIAKFNSINRCLSVLSNNIVFSCWTLFGEVINGSKKKEICIIVVPGIIATYSFRREHEKQESFNPQLN